MNASIKNIYLSRLSHAAVTLGAALMGMTVVLGFSGCDGDEGPVITRAEVLPHPDNALMATVEIETDVPARVYLDIANAATGIQTVPSPTGLATEHTVPVLGLRAESRYEFIVEAVDEDGGRTVDTSLSLISGALPLDFPAIEVSVPAPEQVASGITVFSIGRIEPDSNRPSRDWGIMVGLDADGEVVWYQDTLGFGDLRRLDNGNFLYMEGSGKVVEMDPTGVIAGEFLPADVGIDSMHHDIIRLPSGNYLTLSTELRTVAGYTDAEGNEVSYPVVGDVIVEFSPTGEIVQEVSMFDLIDPLRIIEPEFHLNFYDGIYGIEGTKDWTHGNAVVMHPDGDAYVIALRHQDWLLKIDRETGALLWSLGPEGDFAFVGDGGFAYHLHAPEFQADGALLVYDNGNGRPLEEGDRPHSRAVQFRLDEENFTVSQEWDYRIAEPYFTPNVGDADRLENGNVLVTQGSLSDDAEQQLAGPGTFARITEVTGDSDASPVMDIVIDDAASAEADYGYMVYRAERISSLYPGQ